MKNKIEHNSRMGISHTPNFLLIHYSTPGNTILQPFCTCSVLPGRIPAVCFVLP